ncbi:MAG: redoxin domain-containing protein [Deltaproteobacteria bacterium]|nr:redoxin domain-containing protein [Deltaproteobacteria bacterium]
MALMAQGNARKARPTLTALHSQSDGKAWREQVGVLLADARVSVGEVAEGRTMLTEWRDAYPMSKHMALATIAEGKAVMKDAKRIADSPDGGLPPAKKSSYNDAITLFDKAITGWPEDPSLEQAYLNKAALLGEMGQMDEAEAAASELAGKFPGAKQAPRALFNVARAAFDDEDYPRAERIYTKLVEAFPKDRLSKSARSNLSSLKLLGKPAPELDITEWVGDDLGTMASMKGKPTLLLFWATWCPHCRKAMPGIEENVWQKYRDQGLNVVAVTKNSRGQTTDKVRDYMTENGYTMPVAIDPGTTSRNYGVSGIPAAALVDKDGNVVFRNHPSQVNDALIQKHL